MQPLCLPYRLRSPMPSVRIAGLGAHRAGAGPGGVCSRAACGSGHQRPKKSAGTSCKPVLPLRGRDPARLPSPTPPSFICKYRCTSWGLLGDARLLCQSHSDLTGRLSLKIAGLDLDAMKDVSSHPIPVSVAGTPGPAGPESHQISWTVLRHCL